jgi:hypothetical protein
MKVVELRAALEARGLESKAPFKQYPCIIIRIHHFQTVKGLLILVIVYLKELCLFALVAGNNFY